MKRVTQSSTRKAAKLAQRGKGRKVRFQGGTLFPAVVALVLVLGIVLIAYSRQSLPAADESPPGIEDHWHAAYGFFLCDDWYELAGNLEELDARGNLTNNGFLRTGVHGHDDGVVHWHPYTSAGVGANAVLDVFLDNYGVELTNQRLTFDNVGILTSNPENPPDNGFDPLEEYVEGETQCDGEDAELTVKAWGSYTDTDNGNRYIANMDRVHLDNDGMVFGIYFTPKDTDQPMPPWAQNLPALGAADQNATELEDVTGTTPASGSTLPGAPSVAPDSTETEASTVPASVSPPDTRAADTAASPSPATG
jgi:hypothetical protein